MVWVIVQVSFEVTPRVGLVVAVCNAFTDPLHAPEVHVDRFDHRTTTCVRGLVGVVVVGVGVVGDRFVFVAVVVPCAFTSGLAVVRGASWQFDGELVDGVRVMVRVGCVVGGVGCPGVCCV